VSRPDYRVRGGQGRLNDDLVSDAEAWLSILGLILLCVVACAIVWGVS